MLVATLCGPTEDRLGLQDCHCRRIGPQTHTLDCTPGVHQPAEVLKTPDFTRPEPQQWSLSEVG